MGQPVGSAGGAYIQFSPATRERPSDPFELHGREVLDQQGLKDAEKSFLEGNWEGALTQKQIDQRSAIEKGMKLMDDRFEAFLQRYNRNELLSYNIPGSGDKLQFKMSPNKQELKDFKKDITNSTGGMLEALRRGDKAAYQTAKNERSALVSKFLKQVALPHRVALTQTAHNKLRDVIGANKSLLSALRKKDYASIKKIDLNKLGVDKKFADAIVRYSNAAKVNSKTGKVTTRAERELNRMRNGKVERMQALSMKQLAANIRRMETQLRYTRAKAEANGIPMKINKISGKAQVEKATQRELNRLANSVNRALNTQISPKNLQISERGISTRVNKIVKENIRSNTKADLI